jgi:hypothetical protein
LQSLAREVMVTLYRRAAFVAFTLSSCMVAAACGRGDETPPAVDGGTASVGTAFVGCVAQTGQPDVFLLSIVQPRDAQANSPAGSAVPQGNESSAPVEQGTNRNAPVATGGVGSPAEAAAAGTGTGPGSGPTTTARIETYRLTGTGGLDLRAHVGRTIEVTGSVQELPGDRRIDGTTQLMGELHVASARPVADECVR